jgi:antirestriction protein ArdC
MRRPARRFRRCAVTGSEGLILPKVEELIRASRADLRLGGDKAFYAPAHDYIQLPRPESYFEPINWHRTALHELGHNAAIRIMPHVAGARRLPF